jgi:glutamate N-acetyltransferase/amino-acid N-acetyltransferase
MDTAGVSIWLGDVLVVDRGGRAASYTEDQGAAVMKPAEITVKVMLSRGSARTTVWTCDYSYDYVKINAEYRT